MEERWDVASRYLNDLNCTPPAIDDFPADIFTRTQRQAGAVVFHIVVSLYLFLALAVVCDKYFVPAVEKISQALNMSSDICGATFMAGATSSPELFVNVIGTFITEGDIGIGTIVGSAVFNILAVAACCGIGAEMVIPLDWWPLTRDCLAYGFTVAVLICIIHDERVEWYEALILVLLYIVYIGVMYYDKTIQKWARGGVRHAQARRSQRGSLASKSSRETEKVLPLGVDHFNQNGNIKNISHIDASNNDINTIENETTTATTMEKVIEEQKKPNTTPIPQTTIATTAAVDGLTQAQKRTAPKVSPENFELEIKNNKTNDNKKTSTTTVTLTADDKEIKVKQELTASIGIPIGGNAAIDSKNEKNNDDTDDTDSDDYQLFQFPRGKSCIRQIMWAIIWPIHLLFGLTIPNCKSKKFKKLFPFTFLMCIIWIGSLSYIVAWMITIVGDTLNIPDSVMGITFLAAGTSVPEAVSSVIVAKQGHGSMGISNSIGSNTFDILLCLGLPWLIKASFLPVLPGNHWVGINSHGLEYSAISLLSTLLLLYGAFSLNKFKLDRKLGHTCLFIYAVFLVLATLIELNVFFTVNLPACAKKGAEG